MQGTRWTGPCSLGCRAGEGPEQEDQRLKNHYGRWMDIVRSLELESFILIKLTKPRAPGRWTTVKPRKGTTWSRGRRSSGSPRGEEYEGSLVRLRCEVAVAAE